MKSISGPRITRRASLALALGGAATAFTGARAATPGPLEQTKFDMGGNRDPQLGAQVAIASAKNYFKDEGLDVTVRWTDAGGDLIPLMAGGAISIAGMGLQNVVNLRSRGIPIKAISALCDYSGSQGLVLKPGLKLKSPAELAGLKFSAPPTSPHEMALGILARKHGFDVNSIKIVRMQPSESIIAASKGDVDGALVFQPHLSRLIQMGGTLYFTGTETHFDGKKTVLAQNDRLLHVHSLLLAHEDWVAKNPNTALAVVRALARANDLIAKDRPEAEAVVSKSMRADLGATHEAMEQNSYALALDDTVMQSFAFASEWMQKIGVLKQAIDVGPCIDPSVLQKFDPALVSFKV